MFAVTVQWKTHLRSILVFQRFQGPDLRSGFGMVPAIFWFSFSEGRGGAWVGRVGGQTGAPLRSSKKLCFVGSWVDRYQAPLRTIGLRVVGLRIVRRCCIF